MKLRELAEKLDAQLIGDGDTEITGVAGVTDAQPGMITFISGRKNLSDLAASRAAAAFAPPDTPAQALPLLLVKNPRLAFARALGLFYVAPYDAKGISAAAHVGRNVSIGAEPSILPGAVVDDDAVLGDRVTLYPGVSVGKGAVIGDDAVVHANVSIGERVRVGSRAIIHAGTVIGSDGFGFVTDNGRHHKIPQVGTVVIEDDVEIGSNSTIDRATLGATVIKKGTKLDNMVHVAHNVTIGEHCLLAAQVGIAGSTTLGSYVVIGGQAGVADHTRVGDRVMVGGGTAITQDVASDSVIAGHNAMPVRTWLKVQAVLPKLPDLKKQIAELEQQVKNLQAKLEHR